MIGRAVGGIRFQVVDGETGFLVKGVEDAVERTLHLLKHPEEAERLGIGARERVRENFLITRHLERYLDLLGSLH